MELTLETTPLHNLHFQEILLQKELSIIGLIGSDKVYDDTTMASASGTATLSGVEPGDDVILGGSPVFLLQVLKLEQELQLRHLDTLLAELTLETTPLHNLHFQGKFQLQNLISVGLVGDNKEYDGTNIASASGT